MPRVIRRESTEHHFAWHVFIEPGQEVALFSERWMPHPPVRSIAMERSGGDSVTFCGSDCYLAKLWTSRPDVRVRIDIGTANWEFCGPWLVLGHALKPLVVPVRQHVAIFASLLDPKAQGEVDLAVASLFIREL